MKVVIIDGQGGKIGASIVKQLKQSLPEQRLLAIGTNSIATAAMLKAGAELGATGENPVKVNCRDADIIIGPLGIVLADSFLGEIIPAMALAIAQSPAHKILIPVNRCKARVVGVKELPLSEYIQLAIEQARDIGDASPCRS